MQTKTKIIFIVFILAASFVAGRYTAPTKIKTETKIVEVEKKIEKKDSDTEQNKHKDMTVVETTRPDGTKEVTTHIVEDSKTDRTSHSTETDQTSTTQTQTKEVTRSTSRLNIYALAGTPVSINNLGAPVYGAHVSKDLFGPISLGIWGFNNGVAGVSIGFSF